jgi:23S rRNA (cytidine2498-2'-O)-methyltransferase
VVPQKGGLTHIILASAPSFEASALNEVRRSQPDTAFLKQIAPGYSFLETPLRFEKFTAPWRSRLPIYLHHAFPVYKVLNLKASLDDLTQIREMSRRIGSRDAIVQVQSTVESRLPYSPAEIQQFLNEKQDLHDISRPTGNILSVLLTDELPECKAYMGVSGASENLSPWPGGQIPITEVVPNRAGYKLLEAIDAFSVRLRRGDCVLDLGASPGAWTTILRRRGLHVTAVAPAPLYPWLMFDSEVVYQPLLAEEFLDRCQATYHLIVNDMKMDAQDSARLMVEYASHLCAAGIAIMTLKLRNRNRQRVMDHAFRILRQRYRIIRVRQLVSNRQEVTLFLRRNT